jgi:NadR type nicotinamide-nucleotide adenylyltransferase
MIHSYQKPLSGKSVGVVFGSFAPLHQGHLDCIMRAKKENDGGAIVIVCGFDGDKGGDLMPLKRRYRYVREFFADDDLVAVYAIDDGEIGAKPYPDGWEQWMDEFNKIWKKAVKEETYVFYGDEPDTTAFPIRHWYVGDPNYASDLEERGEHVTLLDRVADNPICATMIRQNPIKNWDKITFPFRRLFSHNILICGTASEGKSTLTTDLGKYFNAPYSYEWARDYMRDSCVVDWELDGADYMAFLEGQYNLNKQMINSPGNHGIFFADSDSMVTRMYAEYYAQDETCALTQEEFERVAVMADEITRKSRWDKIFLLAPHGVFVDDHERYMAHSGMKERQELFEILCKNIKASGNWDKVTILTGNYYENFMVIVKYVRDRIEKGMAD